MAASAPNFSDFELKVEFRDDYVVHTADGMEEIWDRGEIIGRGAFGKVFLQKRQGGEQLRAVKEVPLEKSGISQELLAFINTKEHDHLFVKFLGWYKNSHDMFFVMEYLQDGDLGIYMAQNPSKAKGNAKEITIQILQGLEVLHKKKICHRDLKPQNVLIASLIPICVKIADFGVAKQTTDSTAKSGWGTENYRAPEAIHGFLPVHHPRQRGLSYALDIWSLGCLLHELLTFQTPFLDLTTDEPETGVAAYTSPQRMIDMGVFFNYCRSKVNFPIGALQDSQVSKEGIDFIKSLLAASPEKRPTATSALQNLWLNNSPPESVATAVSAGKASQSLKLAEARSVGISSWLGNAAKTARLYGVSLFLGLEIAWSAGNASPLLKAVEAGDADKVTILLKGEVEIYSTDCKKCFMLAVRLGYPNIVKLFLANKINVDTFFGDLTALQIAAGSGHTDIVKLLLDSNANVNARGADYDGRTPLQVAAGGGHTDIVKLLLDSKADVNAKASRDGGRTALQAAAEGGHTDIVKLLLDSNAHVNAEASLGGGRTALQAAAGGGHTETVKLLLDRNAYVNAEASWGGGRTALQAAAGGGHIETVKLLLDSNAYVNAEASWGGSRTALIETFKLLLDSNAYVNAEASWGGGRTALQAAAGGGHIEIVKLLLDSNADVNGISWYGGRTALQAAAGGGYIEIVRLLLDSKADVNAEASRDGGRTALQAAVEGGHIDIVKLLLANKADIYPGGGLRGLVALGAGNPTRSREVIRILEAAEKLSLQAH